MEERNEDVGNKHKEETGTNQNHETLPNVIIKRAIQTRDQSLRQASIH